MANTNVSNAEVKSICSSLECSPSQHDSAGAGVGGKPSLSVGGTSAASGSTSEFKMERKSGKIPGYTGRFAQKAAQS